jgi:type II secretory pathway component PulF
MNVMTTSRRKVLALAALVTVLMVLMVVDPALAEKTSTTADSGSTTNIGQNLGREVQSWGSALLLGVAALVGLPALAKRDLGQSMVVAMITIVLGGFIFAGDTVKTMIDSIWSTVGR